MYVTAFRQQKGKNAVFTVIEGLFDRWFAPFNFIKLYECETLVWLNVRNDINNTK